MFTSDFFICIIMIVNKVLYVNKPKGITSFDVCFKLRKVFKTKAIGHTGTLDPLAEGVMIILIDKACKANQFLVKDDKTYHARVKYGIMTDTLDIEGKVVETASYQKIAQDELEEVLKSFLGRSKQVVPLTSAIKINGKKLYEYQREKIAVEIPSRDIEIYDIKLLDVYDDGFSFEARVSSGTYIRSLVRDIMARLNTLGTLCELKRVKVGNIGIEKCDDLTEVLRGHYHLYDLYDVLKDIYPVYEVEDDKMIKDGKPLYLNDYWEDDLLICKDKEVLAIYHKKTGNEYRSKRGLF